MVAQKYNNNARMTGLISRWCDINRYVPEPRDDIFEYQLQAFEAYLDKQQAHHRNRAKETPHHGSM